MAIAAGGLGAAAAAAPGTAGASTPSAASLYKTAMANIAKTGSVHFVGKADNGGITESTVGDAGQTSGKQVLVLGFGKDGTGRAQIRIVGTTAYVMANKTFYKNTGLATTVPPTGTWLSVPSSDNAYQQLASGLTVATVGSQIAMTGPYSYGPTARVNGVTTVSVRGTTKEELASGKTGTIPVTVWIKTSGTPLPVKGLIKASKQKYTASFTLSHYGKTVNVQAPTTSTPASKYGG